MCTYPGPDGTLSVKCPHGCLNGRVMEGAMACNVCNRPANPDVLLQSQVTRMQLRGTHTAWRKYVERCARETMPMRWWKGPVTFVQGAEFAMAVAVRLDQYPGRNWLDICVREALFNLGEPESSSTADVATLFNIFSHVKQTLLCLKNTNGAYTANQTWLMKRTQISKAIKARIEYKAGETFDCSKLNLREFKDVEHVATLDVAALRKRLKDDSGRR